MDGVSRQDLVGFMRRYHDDPETIASAAQRLLVRYDFFMRGTAEHDPKYPSGEVPKWMIIGSVEPERERAFAILEEAGVFVETGSGTYRRSSVDLDDLLAENRVYQDS